MRFVDIEGDRVASLGFGEQVQVWQGRLPALLGTLAEAGLAFDLMFADPPYERGQLDRLLVAPALVQLAAADSTLVVEHRHAERIAPGLWEIRQARRYGDTALSFCAPKRED